MLPIDVTQYSFDTLKQAISSQRNVFIYKDEDSKLIMIHNEWKQAKPSNEYRRYRCMVAHEDAEGKLTPVMYSFPSLSDDIRDNTSINNLPQSDVYTVAESFEGPTIHVYYAAGKWRFSTTKCLDMFRSKFGTSSKSHGDLFAEVVGDMDAFVAKLDPTKSYHFVVVHPANKYLVDYSLRAEFASLTNGFLVHILTRNCETFEQVDVTIDVPFVHKPTTHTYTDANDVKKHLRQLAEPLANAARYTTHEGIVVATGEFSTKYHTEAYISLERMVPNCHSLIENYVKAYQRNTLELFIWLSKAPYSLTLLDGKEVAAKLVLHSAFRTTVDILFGLYTYFSRYNPSTKRYEKLNENDFKKHINDATVVGYQLTRLQELSRRFGVQLDKDHIMRHLHNDKHTTSEELIRLMGDLSNIDRKFLKSVAGSAPNREMVNIVSMYKSANE